jgi:hypothetical protein
LDSLATCQHWNLSFGASSDSSTELRPRVHHAYDSQMKPVMGKPTHISGKEISSIILDVYRYFMRRKLKKSFGPEGVCRFG